MQLTDVRVLSHLPDGLQQEQDQHEQQQIEIGLRLSAQHRQEATLEEPLPSLGAGHRKDQHQHDEYLHIEEGSDQAPNETHFAEGLIFFLCALVVLKIETEQDDIFSLFYALLQTISIY